MPAKYLSYTRTLSLTELAVAVAAPAQSLQVPLQHIGEEIAGRNLHRIPAQRLTDLRHRYPQQPPRVRLAHAGWARLRFARARPGPGGPREAHAGPAAAAAILAPRFARPAPGNAAPTPIASSGTAAGTAGRGAELSSKLGGCRAGFVCRCGVRLPCPCLLLTCRLATRSTTWHSYR